MQSVITRRAMLLGLVMALAAGLAPAPVSAQGGLIGLIGTSVVRGTITALGSPAGTLQVTNRDGLSIDLTTNAQTQIRRDGRSATLADLRVSDLVLVWYERTTRLARRVEAASPPPVELHGTITALDAAGGTIQVTTDHGTQITLTTNVDTRVRLNRANTTLGNLAVGQRVAAAYRPEDKIALALAATTPRPNVVSGAITAVDLTAGTLQVTPVAGAPVSLKVSPETEYRLNGRRVAPTAVGVGLLASIATQPADTARVIAAQTPPLVDLAGTISALDVQGGTLQVTTAAMTTITLRLTPQTVVRRNDAASTAEQLAIGDRVVVRYEYLLLPNQSRALRIIATAAAPAPPPTGGAAALTAVVVDPASVVGGAASTGTVTLSAAAPSGGLTVNLTSSPTAAATVPASVVVAEGATTATFPVTTNAVAAVTPVTITAAAGSTTVTATLTVNPATTPPPAGPTVTALAVNPASVDGGAASTGTVTLSAAAPAGGVTVTLTSNDAVVATVPASVVVAEGATTATFPVTTGTVITATPVTLTAAAGGATATATLTVNPTAAPSP